MEKRLIVAFALSAAFLFVWMWVYETYLAPPPPKKAAVQAPGPVEAPKVALPAQVPASEPSKPPAPEPRPARAVDTAPVPRPPYRGVVSSEGGKLQEWTLKYRGEKPMVIVGEVGPTGLIVAASGGKTGAVLGMSLEPDALELGPARPTQELVLTGHDEGLRVRQTLQFHADRFVIETRIRVENAGATARSVSVAVPWSTRQTWGDTPERFAGQHPKEIVWSADHHVVRIDDFSVVRDVEIDGGWIGLDSVWYLSALIPRGGGFKIAMSSEKTPDTKEPHKGPAGRVGIAVHATPTIPAGQAWEGHVLIYVGPKEYDRLAALGLEETINFGGFPMPRKYGGLPMEWLGVPILRLLKWVNGYVGNYGIAIIMLTVVSKVLFFPLTVKSMRSMKAMQLLAPQVNALRSKYKSDPQRLQRETMELYRKHHVNPLGGCLPMVAQIPIFYALYLALSVSVELQNASFLCVGRAPDWIPFLGGKDLWICDLANFDPIYVLPLLMGVSMFVQQKMTPTTGDPRQAKMMLFMPFVMTIMFFNLPAGLVLYWTVSNLLQILQQRYMDWPGTRAAAREAKDASRA